LCDAAFNLIIISRGLPTSNYFTDLTQVHTFNVGIKQIMNCPCAKLSCRALTANVTVNTAPIV